MVSQQVILMLVVALSGSNVFNLNMLIVMSYLRKRIASFRLNNYLPRSKNMSANKTVEVMMESE